MRIWLDEHRFEPSRFKYSEDGNYLLIDVSFKVAVEAAAFSARFNGEGAHATSISLTPIDVPVVDLHTMSTEDRNVTRRAK